MNFKDIATAIEAQIKKFPNASNEVVVLFDNLSTLPNEGSGLLSDFNIISTLATDNNLNVVVNFNKELSGTEIYHYLYNWCDIQIEFKQNESGYSKDVDGFAKFSFNSMQMKEWNLRYSIRDTGINFFPHLIV